MYNTRAPAGRPTSIGPNGADQTTLVMVSSLNTPYGNWSAWSEDTCWGTYNKEEMLKPASSTQISHHIRNVPIYIGMRVSVLQIFGYCGFEVISSPLALPRSFDSCVAMYVPRS